MLNIIVNFCHVILITGIVPTDWCLGVMKPLYKNKGSVDDPENYRGITLLSCIGKLFTAIVKDTKSAGILGEERAAFRKDHIFVLYSLVEWYLHKKKRLYCAFVDYKKALTL